MENVDEILDKDDKEKWDKKIAIVPGDTGDFIVKPAQDEINTFKEYKPATSYAHSSGEAPKLEPEIPRTLTGIYLVINLDGVHKDKELIGYIDEDPFVVLHQLLSKFYISGYNNDELYPIFMAGYKYSILIKNEGDSYDYANINKPKVRDIEAFYHRYTKMNLAKIDNKYSEEYLNLLSMATNSNPDLQEAIDLQDYKIELSKIDNEVLKNNKLKLISYLMGTYLKTKLVFESHMW